VGDAELPREVTFAANNLTDHSLRGLSGCCSVAVNSSVLRRANTGWMTAVFVTSLLATSCELLDPGPARSDTDPPVVSNGQPTGTLAAGTSQITMSVTTDDVATCRWGTSSSTSYANLANTFTTTGGTSHATTLTGLTDGQSYTRYVRCQDGSGNANPSSYTISFSIASGGGGAPVVGLYDLWEDTIVNANAYSNPFDFDVVELRATFTSPSGNSVRFVGFYDGDGQGGQNGQAWKLRFMPTELGTWSYTYSWTDGTPGGSGSFEAVASLNKGSARIDPAYPYSLIYANGERLFWNGDTEWFFLSDDFTQDARLNAIDFLASKKVNNLLMVMVNDDTYDVFPWVSRNEMDRFDLSRMRRWEGVVEALQARGVIADLWFYSDASFFLVPAAGSKVEDLYFKYIIARFAAYSNVTWNLALEYEEYRTSSWVEQRAAFVKDQDPFDHLLAVHQTTDGYAFPGNPNLDHTSLQRLGADHATLNSVIRETRAATLAAGRPIAIMHEEFFIEGTHGDLTQFRQGIWAITTGGGFFKAASLGWWIGTPYENGQHFDIARILYDFITRIPYWEMGPRNDLVSTGYALVKLGQQYVVYLPSGGAVTIDLSAASGTLNVEWYDPRTGAYSGQTTTTGGGMRTLSAPATDDWVLHIAR